MNDHRKRIQTCCTKALTDVTGHLHKKKKASMTQTSCSPPVLNAHCLLRLDLTGDKKTGGGQGGGFSFRKHTLQSQGPLGRLFWAPHGILAVDERLSLSVET
jgi:hypothetical protein